MILMLMVAGLTAAQTADGPSGGSGANNLGSEFAQTIRPVIAARCFECHSTEIGEGGVDLEQFEGLDDLRAAPKTWLKVADVLETGEMPPEDAGPLPDAERATLRDWLTRFLKAEAAGNAGDPGPVLPRRLTNAQYTHTIRDLTGLGTELDPAREFPTDSAAGEGFTNTGGALVMSPSLLTKYLDAAREVAAHAVLLPDGLRFSPGTSPRDWTDEALARIRRFYARFSEERDGTQVNLQGIVFATNQGGRLPLAAYLDALLADREAIRSGIRTIEALASETNLSPTYLRALWKTLETDETSSLLLDGPRAAWRSAGPGEGAALAARFVPWQQALWRFHSVGHIGKVGGPTAWMEPVTPLAERQPIRAAFPPDGASAGEIRLFLAVGDAGDGAAGDLAIWERPRIVTPGRPDLPLRDIRALARHLTARRTEVLSQAAACLDAAAIAMRAPTSEALDKSLDTGALAARAGVSEDVLNAWFGYLGVGGGPASIPPESYLTYPLARVGGYDFVAGFGSPDTPNVIANSSDQHVRVPGNMKPHGVAMHPSPQLRIAAGWRSPVAGIAQVRGVVQHAHPECGNGVTWRLERRRGSTRQRLASGIAHGSNPVNVGPIDGLVVDPGDLIALSIGPRDGNHACDLTAVDVTIEIDGATWDLAAEVSPDITAGNPHADRRGNPAVWHVYTEPDTGATTDAVIPDGSLLARWLDPRDPEERAQLARAIQSLLDKGPPAESTHPDAALYRQLTALRGPLLDRLRPPTGDEIAAAGKDGTNTDADALGLDPARFGRAPDGSPIEPTSLAFAAPTVIEIRLPAELVAGSEFVAEGVLHAVSPSDGEGSVQFLAALAPPAVADGPWADALIVARPETPAWTRIAADLGTFRDLFPPALCYTKIVPVDEVVTLTLFYREDDHLRRLMLDETQAAELDRLWEELHFVSGDALTLVDAFQQLLEYASQDGDPRQFEPLREPIERRAAAFRQTLLDAEPRHLDAVVAFAARAYRRPLSEDEADGLRSLYRTLRDEAIPHDEAIRMVLARILVAPAFLYRIEKAAPGATSGPVTPWELASRLSYFLWSSMPDDALRARAAAGDLGDPEVLAGELRRMLQDERTRRLAEEFGGQWLHVYDFIGLDEKSERHFPTFAGLRADMAEETTRVFLDLFQNDRSVLSLIDADHTFLNEPLARHYGIEGVTGPEWRRVDGVRERGRGGILTLATTLAKQSGASRTSPILRGNWISEVLLGEKLPRPPKNVPQLPDDEAATEGLTVRQLVERHTSDPRCASCHARIDPFGFALERYDAIGRLRERDLADRPIDTRTTLPDGTAIDGIDGLRAYLLTTRRDAFVRQFNRKLLGYALGRSVQLSDEPLLDAMKERLQANEYRVSAALETIVLSRPFREIRGREAATTAAR